MNRKEFIKLAGISAFAISASGFTILQNDGTTIGNCATSTDMLGPFYRKGAPFRNDLTTEKQADEVIIKVKGTLYAADCKTPISNALIDVWHCDEKKKYDMKSDDYAYRGQFYTNEKGEYWYKTILPPPYAGRPKHIHYLVHEIAGHQELITQLYFKGDSKIKRNNWVKYPWDERRILEIYTNEEEMAEVRLDLFLTTKE